MEQTKWLSRLRQSLFNLVPAEFRFSDTRDADMILMRRVIIINHCGKVQLIRPRYLLMTFIPPMDSTYSV